MISTVLLSLALSQGLSPGYPGVGGGKVLASFPLSTSGALITEDALTVAHVYWQDGTLVDTKGNAWTQNGTVPKVTANPFTTTRYGAGPFSDANYYSLGTGTDVLDFSGDFTVCVVYDGMTKQTTILSNQNATPNNGWDLVSDANDSLVFNARGSGAVTTASTVSRGSVKVGCVGKLGANIYAKLSLGTTASAARTITPATGAGEVAMIGRLGLGGYHFVGTIYEVYATSTAWDEATVTAIQQRVLGHFDGYSALSVTRASNATYENPAGTVWTAAPGVARITTDGLLVEPARTQFVLNSSTHPKTAEASGSITAQACVGWHTGTGNMTIANGTATTTGLSCTAVAPGTLCTFTVTVAGTMAVTTAAGVTHAQIECPGSYRTSQINTAGTAVARNADAISATAPAGTTFWSYALNGGARTGAAASPGTLTFVEGRTKNVKVCGKAKSLKECK